MTCAAGGTWPSGWAAAAVSAICRRRSHALDVAAGAEGTARTREHDAANRLVDLHLGEDPPKAAVEPGY
jgi:hypothetical protein